MKNKDLAWILGSATLSIALSIFSIWWIYIHILDLPWAVTFGFAPLYGFILTLLLLTLKI